MNKRLLVVVFALIVLTFVALLAFLPSVFGIHAKPAPVTATTPTATAMTPPAATPAVPAAKKPSPATKTTIMGTPAQLVADLKAAGLDMANMRVLNQELRKKDVTATSGANDSWFYSGATIYTNSKNDDLERIQIDYEKDPASKPEYQGAPAAMKRVYKILAGGKESLYKRYGTAQSATTISGRTHINYAILFQQKDPVLWRCSISYEADGSCNFIAKVDGKHFSELAALNTGSSIVYEGERSILYSDLAQMGFAPGMPCTKPDVLAKGYASSGSGVKRYSNGSVCVDSGDKIKWFMNDNNAEGILFSIMEKIADPSVHLNKWPGGEFSRILSAGKDTAVTCYGAPETTTNDDRTVNYFILLNDGSSLVPIRIYFTFTEEKGRSNYFALGRIIASKYYLIQSTGDEAVKQDD